jgi:hypothetical protein
MLCRRARIINHRIESDMQRRRARRLRTRVFVISMYIRVCACMHHSEMSHLHAEYSRSAEMRARVDIARSLAYLDCYTSGRFRSGSQSELAHARNALSRQPPLNNYALNAYMNWEIYVYL